MLAFPLACWWPCLCALCARTARPFPVRSIGVHSSASAGVTDPAWRECLGARKTSSPPTVGSKRTTHRLNEAVVSDACRPIRCSSPKEAFSQIPLAVILSSSHSRAGLRRAASRRRVPAPAHPRVGLAHLVVHPSFDGQQPRPPHAAQAAQTRQTFLRDARRDESPSSEAAQPPRAWRTGPAPSFLLVCPVNGRVRLGGRPRKAWPSEKLVRYRPVVVVLRFQVWQTLDTQHGLARSTRREAPPPFS